MAFTRIVDSDLTDIGVIGLPDRPGLSTTAMQAKLEETARSVIIPKHNGLIDELEDDTAASNIGIQTPTGMTGATIQAVVNDIAEKVRQLDPESLSSKADKVTNAVEGNFAGLDSEGNLTDSGNKAADFAAASHTHTKSDITDFPTLATVATTGAYADLSGQPTLGTASALDVPASGNASSSQVVKGNDSRLSDDRNAADVYSWAKQSTKPSYTASEVGAIASTEKGANGGVAELDSNGKVPSAQLPSYVDDVEEYASLSDFPATGETGKIYIAKDTNKQYRWSGTAYAEISESLALGETSSTAYAGNKGKANADAIDAMKDGSTIDSFGDVESALSGKVDKVSGKGLSTNDYDDTAKGIVDGVTSALAGKVDKVNGKGLSTNDYDNTAKGIVDGVTNALAGKQDKTLSAQVEGQSTVEGALGALSSNKMSYADNGILGAKNLYPQGKTTAVTVNTIITETATGIRIVATSAGKYKSSKLLLSDTILEVGKTYTLSSDVVVNSGLARLTVRNTENNIIANSDIITENGHLSLTFTVEASYNYISLFCTNDTNITADVEYNNLMLTLATDTDLTYQPYAQTNRQLTANKADNTVIAPVENGTTASQAYSANDFFIHLGELYIATTSIAQGATFTVDTNCTKKTVGEILTALLNA